jgi:hypothetical protein
LAVYPLGWHAHLPFYEYVYRHPGIEAHIWKTEGWNLPEYPFYRRRPWNVTVADASDLARAVQAGEAVYFVTRLPYETIDTAELGATARLLTSEFPGWQHACVRAVAGPALRWLSRTLDAIPRAPRATWLSVYRITAAGEPSDPKGLH